MSGGGALPSWARKGVKVVCVGRELREGEPRVINDLGITWRPTRGQIYTISGVTVDATYGAFLFLKEHNERHCFIADGFRPLVSTKTEAEDVARFRKLLTQRIPEAA
jgi:hypothetical protein